MKDFLRDDSAQATTEYILMLFTALSLFLILYSKLLKNFAQKITGHLVDSITNAFVKGDLHRLPFSH